MQPLEFYTEFISPLEGGSQKHLEDIEKMLSQIQNLLDFHFLNEKLNERKLLTYWKKVYKA